MNQVKDKTFMFTGTLSVTRDEAQRIVEELGGIAGSSVNRQTDYLIVGEDQIGKSSKWEKAGLLGVTRVNEEYFWDLVKEAREDTSRVEDSDIVVHLSPEELENGITDEHWEVIARECPNLTVMTGEQFERLLNAYLPSYESKYKLEKLTREYSIRVLPPSPCKFCGETIPYSIHTSSHKYYCFKCHQYSDQKEHRCIWFDPEVRQGYYMCSICGEFTTMRGRDLLYQREAIENDVALNSVEHIVYLRERARSKLEVAQRVEVIVEGIHVCIEYEKDEEMVAERGTWLKCKVCGKRKFVSLDKFEASMRKRTEQSLTK